MHISSTFFLRAIINICIQVIFSNAITYFDRYEFQNGIILFNWCKL